MASMPNRKALLDQLGGDDENPMNTGYNGGSIALDPAGATPIGSGDMESTIAGKPRGGGGDILGVLGSRSGPIDPAETAAYQHTMDDLTKRQQGLGEFDKAGLDQIQKEIAGAQKQYFGAGYQGGGAMPPILEDAAPAAAPPASDYGRLMGYDAGKLNDPNKHDFKYDTARVLSRFDPRQGFTPDVINALNSELGNTYGTFSGSGDKLSLTGAKGAKDAADFANQDWIFAHKANSDATKWNYGGGGAAPQETGSAGGSASGGMRQPGFSGLAGGPALDEALTGDPLARIQQLIAQLSGSRPNFAALMQQLGGQ